jgi:hypothetical protein
MALLAAFPLVRRTFGHMGVVVDTNRTDRPPGRTRPWRRRSWRAVAGLGAALLTLVAAPLASAATQVTVGGAVPLQAVGPTSAEYGFPTWYQDGTGTRLELCLEVQNPLCGFLPGDVPDPSKDISFPDNFPDELFYTLASAQLTLPGGGKATLTSGLEAAFVNAVQPGDQQTFTRIRIVVVGGPPNTTLLFKHPFGELTIDTDATGKGRLVRDIAPSVGNFALALKGDVGPFLKWDSTAPAAPAGYTGDPAQLHTITGGVRNTFEAYDTKSTTPAVALATTNQFTVQGKIATNTGVTADAAVVNGNFIDVFASTSGSALEVVGQAGFPTTIMNHDSGSNRFYARVPFTGAAPTSLDVRNNGDNPPSKATVALQGISVTQAVYDGTKLSVTATASAPATYPLKVEGVGDIPSSTAVTFPIAAPPPTITVSSGPLTTTVPVMITGGGASQAGTTVSPVGPNAPPVCDPSPCSGSGGTVPPTAGPTAKVVAPAVTTPRDLATVIDGSGSTNATTFSTVWKSGPVPTIANGTTNKPSVTLPRWAGVNDTTPQATAADNTPTVVTFTASNGAQTNSVTVTLTPATDTLVIGNARFQSGKDLRVTGTETIQGVAAGAVLNPQTTVDVYVATATGPWVALGPSPVDSTGAWAVRPKTAPTGTYTRYLVQSTRGGSLTGNLLLK